MLASFDHQSQYPGQAITLQGTGFTGVNQVTFGQVPAAFLTIVNDTTITATVPANAPSGAVAITVRNPFGSSTSSMTFTVLALPAKPTVLGFQPSQGPPGTVVTLTGTSFTTVSAVSFGGVSADSTTIQASNDTILTATVPDNAAGHGLISVSNPAGTGLSNGDFTVTVPPTLASFLPSPASPGQPLVLTGTGFTGVTAVYFTGSTPGVSIAGTIVANTDTQITVRVPALAVTGFITVRTPNGSVSSAPSVCTIQTGVLSASGFSPNTGPEGTVVTISGANLGLATAVTFGGSAAVSGIDLAPDGSSLTVRVPPGALSGPVALQTGGGPITVPGGVFSVLSPALSVTGFSTAQVGGVQTVTITGANLDPVTAVAFTGGVNSTTPTVGNNGTTLTVNVPAGALTGPLTLLTPGGPVPVPGGSLVIPVPAANLGITSLTPTLGVPGTEVTVAGVGFTGTNLVTYAGVPLDPGRFDVDSDTQLRVRVPDDAQADGAIAVTTPAGGPVASDPFNLTPSRRTILPQPLLKEAGVDDTGQLVNFPTRRRSAINEDLKLPQAPVFHAYHPDGFDDAGVSGNRDGHLFTRYTLNLQLPTAAYYPMLPDAIKNQLQTSNLAPAAVDILVVSQDYQYDGVTPDSGIYLFRPHYWTDPNALDGVGYNQNHDLTGGIYETGPSNPFDPVTISGEDPGQFFNFTIRTHEVDARVVASGNTLPMTGFDVDHSTGLWSLVYEPATGRVAATLHLLFDDADQEELDALVENVTTVQGLALGLAQSSFAASHGVQMLLALGRPVIGGFTQAAISGSANKLVILTGTSLADIDAVLLDGDALDAGAFRGVSDAIVQVTLPVGATGNIRVQTPLGTSDPILVPAN